MARPGPVERVRARFRTTAGSDVASSIPDGYERMGPVLVLRLPEKLRPSFEEIAKAFADEIPGVRRVLRHAGSVQGEFREPNNEHLWGEAIEACVREHGTVYRFDPVRLLFSRGNKTERSRMASLVRPGERVADLFAGIGYFAIPAARADRSVRVQAVERNPAAFEFLERNLVENHVESQVTRALGDNRNVALAERTFDRVFLGYLPTAVPWIPRALRLLDGSGTLHVHLVADAQDAIGQAERIVRSALEDAGAREIGLSMREVKAYGPGRTHVVVDASVSVAPRT